MTEQEFIKKWIEKIENDLLTNFPDDYIKEYKTETVQLPSKAFSIASELFGQYEVLDAGNNIVIQTDDYYLVKYLLYANRTKPTSVLVPTVKSEVETVVKEYEKLLDLIIKEVMKEIKVVLPTGDTLKVSNQIFNRINLTRY
ncbi:hypothetical protein MNBD_IGNAVI01-2181 [hydrothermal vent metagenome]|uniref:Uncharacterized protein n=1 Tax=hydrothermal vent metagenome TaxID=652676 RepID=A0A3B1CQF4_9ZZZZ